MDNIAETFRKVREASDTGFKANPAPDALGKIHQQIAKAIVDLVIDVIELGLTDLNRIANSLEKHDPL